MWPLIPEDCNFSRRGRCGTESNALYGSREVHFFVDLFRSCSVCLSPIVADSLLRVADRGEQPSTSRWSSPTAWWKVKGHELCFATNLKFCFTSTATHFYTWKAKYRACVLSEDCWRQENRSSAEEAFHNDEPYRANVSLLDVCGFIMRS